MEGEGWSCKIEKLSNSAFKAQIEWIVDEKVVRKPIVKRKKTSKKLQEISEMTVTAWTEYEDDDDDEEEWIG